MSRKLPSAERERRRKEAHRRDNDYNYWTRNDAPREPYATADNEFDYTAEELEFLKAIDRAKRGKSDFSLLDGFRVAKAIGYRKGLVEMAKHKLTITYDEAADALTVTHRCTVPVGGHEPSISEPVILTDEAGVKASLKAVIDANRKEIEKSAAAAAIDHAAAVNRTTPKKGVKRIEMGGTLGILGQTKTG